MAISTTSSSKILTLNTSSLFVSSFQLSSSSYSSTVVPPPPPSYTLLSTGCPLPPVPSDFPPPMLIPGTRFVVDGFRFAGDFSISYFLSHFHSDHYAGLGPSWCRGIVFCSPTTARLLVAVLKVPSSFIVPIALSERVIIDAWEVVAVDANHCPGAVQFLFKKCEVESGRRRTLRYVHTGDFRYSESMKSVHFLREFVGADAVFLDTTYCNPKFVFPSQEESINYVASTIKRIEDHNKGLKEPVGFFIATYVIGKEKILLEIGRRCDCLLHVDARKMEILSILGFGDSGVFTEDASSSHVHVIGWNLLGETWPFFRPNFSKMEELMLERGYTRAVGFVATGWMYETKIEGFTIKSKDSLEIHLVPYSEHSNFEELREYVRFLRPKKVIPTVGVDVDKVDSKHTITLRKHFVGLVDETANKHNFLMAFHQKSGSVELGDKSHVATDTFQEETFEEMVNQHVVPQKHSDTRHSYNLSNEDINAAVDELKSCLPSWVTENQLLDLLKRSNGDIIGAVSEFFEHEIELYKQSNASNSSSSCYHGNVDKPDSLPTFRLTQDIPDSGVKSFTHQARISTNQTSSTKTPPSGKKRGLWGVNKSKKKGKSLSKIPSGGIRQSTITKFFGKVTSSISCESISVTITDDKHLKDNAFDECEKLDHFLQIINDGMPRSSAASLLQKARGSIDVAVDMFYNEYNHKSELEKNSTSDIGEAVNLDSYSEMATNSSEGKTKVPILYVQGTSKEHRDLPNVSLPFEKYLPVEHACWKAGEPAPYLHLARTFDLVEQEKGKIKTTLMLCNMFRSLLALSPDDVLPAVYLCTNKIAADHENMELNIGGSLVVAALEEACGRRINGSRIKEMYKLSGDLGDVAQEIRQSQRLLAPPGTLSIRHLFTMLRDISMMTGTRSSLQKKNIVLRLMHSCREMEIKFLVRTLVRNLRIGAMMKTILPAVAQAMVLNNYQLQYRGFPENLKMQLQGISAEVAEAYNILPNLDLLIPSILSKGTEFSASILTMVSGTPIPPMLAKITNGVTQVLKLFEGKAFTCEYKYDGQRAQIHRLADGSVRVFSRKMKESTSRFPDIVDTIKELCRHNVSNFILDAEVVAVDRKNGSKIKSFQELSSRERGNKESSIPMDGIKVEICIFIFDIMLYNGERLLDLPLRQRRKYMKDLFYEKAGYMEFAREITVEADESKCCDQSTLSKVNLFFEDACNLSCEGIMVKTLDVEARYSASKRSDAWLKVKRDYVEGSGDSLDLVPIGAWYGNGRKAGWYSPFLMACYNPDTEEFQSVCRVMSGFSDSFYIEMKEFFSGDKLLAKKPAYYQTDELPPLWFLPELVWEIRGSDLTLSPVHHAALGFVHPSRGISMRLPRFVRSLSDRNPEDCSTATDVAFMYNSQTRKMDVNVED